jgi:hypothetical protein
MLACDGVFHHFHGGRGDVCGELLAAQLAGEPLPVPLRHARALAPQRRLRPS